MRALYKVVLNGEDGSYVLRDGFRSYEAAERFAAEEQSRYEGDVYIEEYTLGCW